MSTSSTNLGLTIWNSDNDIFDYRALATNFQLIDNKFTSPFSVPVQYVESSTTVPAGSPGRLIYLTAADSGFTANTLIQYRGGQWYEVGQPELVTSNPTQNNYIGRLIINSLTGAISVCTNAGGSGTFTQITNTGISSVFPLPSNTGGGAVANQLFFLSQADSTTANGPYPKYSLAYCTAASAGAATYLPVNQSPAGVIQMFAGATGSVPTGWLLCDGSVISRTTYSTLFAAISTQYGVGDGATTFGIPDLRGRIPVGYAAGGHADVSTLGATDGTSLANRSPKHSHTVNDPKHAHDVNYLATATGAGAGSSGSLASYATGQTASASTGITVGPASGATRPVDGPAYITVNYIIKT